MSDWLGLGFFILVIFGAWYGFRVLSKPRPKLTEQEFEKRINEGRGLVNVGMMELDKFINPGAGKAIEVVEEVKDGKFNKKQAQGDGDDKNIE